MDPILLGKGITDDIAVTLQPRLGNRHGLVAGATGTGKTVTLMTLAEGFSRIGVPVFLADVKGDVAGLAVPGAGTEALLQRAAEIGVTDYAPAASPTVFWDLYGKLGHPVRTTVSEMGPTLLARILELNDTQSGVLDIVFKLADDRGLLLLDLDDLRALLGLVAEERKDISTEYGLVSAQSVAAIQRSLLRLAQDGGEAFFGEPALELADIMRVN
ncbi:helicase HerA-like domain-containing protein, partial [Stenotrophomonas sp.]|uniref:helicase HerA-like domain-containing protein n=1 Tax=Stenotrophomonas sp. TaxID=69392 RepID=UPI00289DF303